MFFAVVSVVYLAPGYLLYRDEQVKVDAVIFFVGA